MYLSKNKTLKILTLGGGSGQYTLLSGLRDIKSIEITAIASMADNGGLSTSEGNQTSNLPLRAGKGWLYEGGIREPMMIKYGRYGKFLACSGFPKCRNTKPLEEQETQS